MIGIELALLLLVTPVNAGGTQSTLAAITSGRTTVTSADGRRAPSKTIFSASRCQRRHTTSPSSMSTRTAINAALKLQTSRHNKLVAEVLQLPDVAVVVVVVVTEFM